jgi:hypothetical protein
MFPLYTGLKIEPRNTPAWNRYRRHVSRDYPAFYSRKQNCSEPPLQEPQIVPTFGCVWFQLTGPAPGVRHLTWRSTAPCCPELWRTVTAPTTERRSRRSSFPDRSARSGRNGSVKSNVLAPAGSVPSARIRKVSPDVSEERDPVVTQSPLF